MGMTPERIRELLLEDESSSLDFKRDQYDFENASDDQKSELLKDIIAFANAWRRSDAYILIGVEEEKAWKRQVVGVEEHFDDANIQQFVNSKTQRPVHFSYEVVSLDECRVGVIHIPIQERPIYLKRDYGKLNKETVYIRRGSSTMIAVPDEVANMGRATIGNNEAFPLLSVAYGDPESKVVGNTSAVLDTINLVIPDRGEIPNYVSSDGIDGLILDDNRDYYRDLVDYLTFSLGTKRINFAVTNDGSVAAHGVQLEMRIQDPNEICILYDADAAIPKPSKNRYLNMPTFIGNHDVTIVRSGDEWLLTADIGKVQPKRTAYTYNGVNVGAREEASFTLRVLAYADNLSAPTRSDLQIQVTPRQKTINQRELRNAVDPPLRDESGED